MNVEISVIVPVYKTEKYLEKCIESIVTQSYRNFELILVDDGSPDKCPRICEDFSKKYDFVRVVHKENGGLSDARNVGVSIAKGQYISFIDSDDFVSNNYLEILIHSIKKYNADISAVGIKRFYEDGKNISYKVCTDTFVLNGTEALKNMLYQKDLDTSACGLLIKRELVEQNLFPKGKYHEDEFTTYKYYANANNVAICKQKGYFYLQRAGSIMHSAGQATIDEIEAADNLVLVCEENWKQAIDAAKSKKFSDYCQVLLSTVDIETTHYYILSKIKYYLNEHKIKMLFDNNARIKNRLAALLIILFGIRGFRIFNKLKIFILGY